MAANLSVEVKRAYDPASAEDGTRVLVDRLWPRGLKKANAAIDQWLKDLAPSTELRKWFGHAPERWREFRRRYGEELLRQSERLDELRTLAAHGRVTLLFSAHDEAHNNAVALRDVLLAGRGSTSDIDEVGEETFPASDPPAWTVRHMGRPMHAGTQNLAAADEARKDGG